MLHTATRSCGDLSEGHTHLTLFSRLAILAASRCVLSAAPVTWYLNNVTFSDGGRAVGSFVYDATTGTLSAVNIQTMPGPATTSGASAIAGGNYPTPFSTGPTTPLVFLSGGTRRLQLAATYAALTNAGGSVALTGAGSSEGFCNNIATHSALLGGPSRSIATGQLVAAAPNAPVSWYMIATMDDGSQAIGSFDFDGSTSTFSNVDVSLTGGSTLTTSARLITSRPLGSNVIAVFQTDLPAKAGSRVFVMNAASSLAAAAPNAVVGLIPGTGGLGSYQGACPPATPANCPVATPTNVLFGTITNTRPPGYTRVVSQVADGGGWQTSLIITNLTDAPARVPSLLPRTMALHSKWAGIGSYVAATIPPRGVAFLTSSNPASLMARAKPGKP